VTGALVIYEQDRNRPGTLSDNRVNSVYFDRSGTMWVGTQNGLNEFDRKKGTFAVYARREGLPGNAVGRILEDDHGNLWMGTNNGVARFDPRNRTFQSYSTPDGLPGADLTGWSAGFRSSSGEMFFGGFSGATAFFPDKVTEASYTPPIVLTDFHLSGNAAETGGGSLLQTSISYTKDLVLSHDQNIFTLTFAALSYSNPLTKPVSLQAGRFATGLDRSWQRPEASYIHNFACRQLHIPRTGIDQPWAVERTRRDAAHPDLASLVGHLVVSGDLHLRRGLAVVDALSSAATASHVGNSGPGR